MAEPLTFGVEFEILVAALKPGFPVPNDAYDELTWRFDPTTEQVQKLETEWTNDSRMRTIPNSEKEFEMNYVRNENARKHIAQTLSDAGIPAHAGEDDEFGHRDWLVTDDSSLGGANDDEAEANPWFWASVEIVSPALSFTQDSLDEVAKLCEIVRSNYRYKVDYLTSMHVHVGDGNKSFPLQVLKNLAAVMWAFEPQFLSLHPIDRVNTWVRPPRFHSKYTSDTMQKQTRGATYPHPIQAIHQILSMTSVQDLTDLISDENNERYMFIQFANVACIARGVPEGDEKQAKPTLEFRQHSGTLDGERATKWIKTVVGLVDAVRKLPQTDLEALVNICANEKWSKLGNCKDKAREADFGPIMAESTFTAVDLFRFLGLDESADYYDGKLYEHDYSTLSTTSAPIGSQARAWFWIIRNGRRENRFDKCISRNPFWAVWDYETADALRVNPKEGESYKRNHKNRLLWEKTMVANVATKDIDPNNAPQIKASDPMWPTHKYIRPVSPPPPTPLSSPSPSPPASSRSGSSGIDSDAADAQKEIVDDIQDPEAGLDSSDSSSDGDSFDGYHAPRLPEQKIHRNYTADSAYAYAAYHARRDPNWIQNNPRVDWQMAHGFTNLSTSMYETVTSTVDKKDKTSEKKSSLRSKLESNKRLRVSKKTASNKMASNKTASKKTAAKVSPKNKRSKKKKKKSKSS